MKKSVKSENPCLAGRQECQSPDWIGTGVIQTSYAIINAHEGALNFNSDPANGTTFIITFKTT